LNIKIRMVMPRTHYRMMNMTRSLKRLRSNVTRACTYLS
jgi:hypothetical protein